MRRGWIPIWLFHIQECPNLGNMPVKCKIKALFWSLIQADKSLWLLTNNCKRGSDKGGILEGRNSQVCSCQNPFGFFSFFHAFNISDILVFSVSFVVGEMIMPQEIFRGAV